MAERGAPPEVGVVVKSTAGHDAGQYFVVTGIKDGFVYLADGKLRMLEKPKCKNIKHIRKTGYRLDLTGSITNKKLRTQLRALQSEEGGNEIV